MPFAATPKFPGAVMGVADVGNLKDYIVGTTKPTLSASLTSGATSFSVATGTGATLPADNFTVTIDSEEMFVTTRSSDALSGITRGVNGTSAASHSSAAPVNHFITANLINQLAAEVNSMQSWNTWRSNPDRPPASANAMDDEFDTTSGLWTNLNVSTISTAISNSAISITSAATGVDTIQGIYQSTPSTPWTFLAKCQTTVPISGVFFGGLVASESATGKSLTFSTGRESGNIVTIYRWSGINGSAAGLGTLAASPTQVAYLKIQDDGTNMKAYYSADGINFMLYSTTTVASTFTTAPNRIGLFVDANSGGAFSCEFFRRTQ
jgi:hypothetical protein